MSGSGHARRSYHPDHQLLIERPSGVVLADSVPS